MMGRRWSDEQQRTYRSFITLGRIADDLQAILVFGAFASLGVFTPERFFRLCLPAFLVLSVFAQYVAPRLFVGILPPHLRSRIGKDRFSGPITARAPHTYTDLLRMWRRPEWRCVHVYLEQPYPAPFVLVISYFGAVALPTAVSVLLQAWLGGRLGKVGVLVVGALAIAWALIAATRFRSLITRRHHTSPSTFEVATVAGIAWLVLAASSAIFYLKAGT